MHFAALNSEEYLEAVKKTPYMTLEDLMEFTLQYGDVYFHPVSLALRLHLHLPSAIPSLSSVSFAPRPSKAFIFYPSLS